MKKLNQLFGLFLLSQLSSCTKDIGNYTYNDINEITITGVDPAYAGISGIDTLKIVPNYEMTASTESQGQLQYTWVAKLNNDIVDTLGTTSNLNYPIKLLPNNYVVQLRVFDQKTNVTWTKKTNFTVGSIYSRGLMLLGEDDNGIAEMDMLSMVKDTVLVKNILAKSGLPPLRGPLVAQHTGGLDATIRVWVSTTSGGYFLDRVSMAGNLGNTFGKLVFLTDKIKKDELFPRAIAPEPVNVSGAVGSNFSRAVLTSNGYIFANSLFGSPDLYGNPINRASSDFNTLLPAAPFLLYSKGSINAVMWYDTKNNRFMNNSPLGLNLTSDILKDNAGEPFPWDQGATGRRLIYAENTRNSDGGSPNGNSFALMKDPNNTFFIYKFYVDGANPAKRGAYSVLPLAIDFEKADFYAFSSKSPIIFYAVGSRLYAYDYNPGNEKFYQFPSIGTDPITLLKFDTQIDINSNSLYIGTYHPSKKGILRKFAVGTDPNTVTIQAVDNSHWEGLIKITSMNWRGVN